MSKPKFTDEDKKKFKAVQNAIKRDAEVFVETLQEMGMQETTMQINGWEIKAVRKAVVTKDIQ